jgi:type II secretory pathway component PulF
MRSDYYELSEFCRQLALLTKAGLPLPGALESVSGSFRKREFRDIVRGVGEDVSKGGTLADAMRRHPDCFPPFFISSVERAERQNALPETFGELAESARMNGMLAALLRDILLYPVITVTVGFGLLILLCFFVIPGFRQIFTELLEGSSLPILTNVVLEISDFVRDWIGLAVVGYAVYVGFLIWLFSGTAKSNRALLCLIKALPLSEMVFYNFAMSSVCALWSVMMRRGTPEKEALETCASMADVPELAAALRSAAGNCEKGMSPADALELEREISPLLWLTLRNAPQERMPDELAALSGMFRDRAFHGRVRVCAMWETVTFTGMAIIAGLIILFLFTPVIFKTF